MTSTLFSSNSNAFVEHNPVWTFFSVLAVFNLLQFTALLEFKIEILDKLDWIEKEDADVFLRSLRILQRKMVSKINNRSVNDYYLFAGDITCRVGVPNNLAVDAFIVVDVDKQIEFRMSVCSLFLIFSLIVFISWVLFGVFSGCEF